MIPPGCVSVQKALWQRQRRAVYVLPSAQRSNVHAAQRSMEAPRAPMLAFMPVTRIAVKGDNAGDTMPSKPRYKRRCPRPRQQTKAGRGNGARYIVFGVSHTESHARRRRDGDAFVESHGRKHQYASTGLNHRTTTGKDRREASFFQPCKRSTVEAESGTRR